MGAVGLSFGSPTSGAGFDVASTVSAIVANLTAAESPYQTQLTTLHAQDAVISNLGTLMSTLATDIDNLTGATGVLSSMEGSSSNTNVLSLTSASTGAVAGSHTIVVSQLAQTSSVYADPIASADTLSGTLSIQVGTGTAIDVAVDPNNDTLSGFAASINEANAGVTASIITGTAGQQLSLTSNTSGAEGDITLGATGLKDSTTNAGVSFHTAQAGMNALMTVDGISASSASNTVSNVIPGVTFQLLDTSPSTPIEVQISNNTSSVGTAVSTLVTDYNAVVSALNTQEGETSSGSPQPLFGNPLISTIQNGLSQALQTSQGSGSSALNIGTIGLSFNSNGTLSLDSDTLNTALTSNFSSIVSLFQAAGGVGQSLATQASDLGNSSSTDVLGLAASQNTSIETDVNATLTTMSANIATQTATLTASLNAANQTLQEIPIQLQEVNQLYAAITGYGQNTNG